MYYQRIFSEYISLEMRVMFSGSIKMSLIFLVLVFSLMNYAMKICEGNTGGMLT